jgi:hypothetical protein
VQVALQAGTERESVSTWWKGMTQTSLSSSATAEQAWRPPLMPSSPISSPAMRKPVIGP